MVTQPETGARYRWAVPDAMIPAQSSHGVVSHESICVLNPTDHDAVVTVEAFFADRAPSCSGDIRIPGRRSLHVRTDDSEALGGLTIPAGVPYGLLVNADVAVHLQYSRLDTTQAAYALMTVLPNVERPGR